MRTKLTICSVPGCEQPHLARGLCHHHYDQLRRKVGLPPPLTRDQRFWIKVDKDGPISDFAPQLGNCWLWTAGLNTYGYGQFQTATRVPMLAHHFLIGKPPKGLEWDHLCRVHNCVRPTHLELVTRPENIRRGARGVLLTRCPQGHEYTPENVWLDKRGHRHCRECNRLNARRFYRPRGH